MKAKRSHRGHSPAFTLLEIMIAVTAIGLLIAMALPQFTSIRSRSQDAAVLNNARQLASAASQYFADSGATVASYAELTINSSYIKSFSPLAGETYPAHFTQGEPIVVSKVGGIRTLSYTP